MYHSRLGKTIIFIFPVLCQFLLSVGWVFTTLSLSSRSYFNKHAYEIFGNPKNNGVVLWFTVKLLNSEVH